MLTINEQQIITELSRAGKSTKEIATRLNRSLGTIYKYRKESDSGDDRALSSRPIQSVLGDFQNIIDKKVSTGMRNSTKIFNELRAQGYKGSYAQVNKYVRSHTHRTSYKPAVRVETAPGEQAQVDWGTFGTIMVNGQREKLHAFVYVLSYSRMLYVEFAIHQNQQVLQRAHIHAFEKYGVPRTIRYDNMKTVVLSNRRSQETGEPIIRYNPAFLDFARYYDFKAEACPPYWPRAKGKVESAVKYLRNNFMDNMVFGKSFHSIGEINQLAQEWLASTANVRLHRTTNQRPVDLLKNEADILRPITNLPPYNPAPTHIRRSTKDGLVQYKKNLYAIPSELSQKKLYLYEVEKGGQQYLEIYYENALQVRHIVSNEQGKWIMGSSQIIKPATKVRADVKVNDDIKKAIRLKPAERELSYYDQLIKRK